MNYHMKITQTLFFYVKLNGLQYYTNMLTCLLITLDKMRPYITLIRAMVTELWNTALLLLMCRREYAHPKKLNGAGSKKYTYRGRRRSAHVAPSGLSSFEIKK